MLPLRLLPRVVTKSLRKRGIEMTNHAGILNVKDRKKRMFRMKNDNELLQDTIGEATPLKYLPQDKRLQLNECNNQNSTNAADKDDDAATNSDTNTADNDDDVVKKSDTNESTNEPLDEDDCTKIHEIPAFGRIVDVPSDGNCEFYAIMVLLVKGNITSNRLTVTEFHQILHDYVLEHVDTVIKTIEYTTCFSNTSARQNRINLFIMKLRRRFYIGGKSSDKGTTRRHWMDSPYDIPIISIYYKTTIGYYDIQIRTTFILSPLDDGTVNIIWSSGIFPPPTDGSMIVFNGINHFGDLQQVHTEESNEVKSPWDTLHPMNSNEVSEYNEKYNFQDIRVKLDTFYPKVLNPLCLCKIRILE